MNPGGLKNQTTTLRSFNITFNEVKFNQRITKIFPFSEAGRACFEFKYSITFGRLLRCSATLFLAFIIPGSAVYSSTNLKQQFFYK